MMFLIIFSIFTVVIQYVNGNCGPCPQIPKHYEEIGCEGLKEPGDCCPTSFKCPDFVNYNTSECQYKGKSYQIREKLSEADSINCNVGCFCSAGFGEGVRPKFTCAIVDCPEWLGYGHDCLRTYDLTSCCAKHVCDKDDMEKLRQQKCSFRGTEYMYGSRIYSDREPCYKCICGENFKNDTNFSQQPDVCGKIDCGIELRSLNRLQDGCAPVYFGDNSCCPIEWRCPDDKDKISEQGRVIDPNDDSMKCQYGKLTLNRYDSLDLDNKCLTCTCSEPPIIQCKKIPDC